MELTLKGLFGSVKIQNAENVSKIPNNASVLKVLDNYFVYANDNFIFFNEKNTLIKHKVKKNVDDYLKIKDLF